jgi:signal transduction histidine kinase
VRLGLRAQLLLALLVVTVGAIVSVGAIAIWQTRLVLASHRNVRAVTLAETAAKILEVGLDQRRPVGDPANRQRLPALVEDVARATEAVELVVYDERGRVVAPEAGGAALPGDESGVRAALAGVVPRAEERAAAAGDPRGALLVAYAPLRLGAARGGVRATFALDAGVDALLMRARDSVLALGAADAILLLVVGSWMLRGTVLRPVRALEEAARRVSAGDLEARVETRGPGELGALADAFDAMTASLRAGRESLIRSEKLAGVGRLAAGVAHEVGNPLAAILGYTEMLLSDTPERPIDAAMRKDVLERVRHETERIHRIIQELLEYARPGEEAVEAVDVARVVAAAVSLVRAQARGRGVTTEVALPAELPPVRASAGRLSQVLVNLLLNAADATGGAGRVRVEARAGGDAVVIAVADDGPGVPEEARARLFEPFFSTKETGKGTGLGLSISLAIVERWGGTIRLAPSERGARFEVRLTSWAGP